MSNSSNNGKENREEELVFELSPIQNYDVTFVEKSKGKSKVDEIRAKGKAKGKDKIRGKGKGLAKFKGEYTFSTRTISVEMDDEDIKELAKDPNVVKIKPDELCEPVATYSAPFYGNASWSIPQTGAEEAFANGVSGQGVKIAVLDSGVDTDNPLLIHAIKGGTSVVDWSTDYEDMTGHGTNVAGTIIAKHEGKAYGIAPDVDLYAVKISISETDGSAYVSSMTRGIEWAITNGMDAINISFSTIGKSDTFENAVQRAKELGIPVFHAGGNSQEDLDNMATRCDYNGVYCISSLYKENTLRESSAFGVNKVKFATYGVSVPSVDRNNPNPETNGGTSIASPVATGIFALYKSANPTMNGNDIVQMMTDNSVDHSSLSSKPVARTPVYKHRTVVSPSTPTLSLVSVNGKTVTLRVAVPSTSATFNKISIDHRWIDGAYEIVSIPSTRSYDFTFTAPDFNTTYSTDVMVYNGDMNSSWSNVLSYTTGAPVVVAPSTPTLSLVSVNGKTVKVRATVPYDSAEFDKLQFDYYWIGGTEDNIVSTSKTRTYDMTFEAPAFNTTYQLDVKAWNGAMSSSWSTALSVTTGAGSGGAMTIIEDFSDDIFAFNFSGNWYRTTDNTYRSYPISHGETSSTVFTIDGGTTGGDLSIDYLTLSEHGYDIFKIYANGQVYATASGVMDIKGVLNIRLSAGNNAIAFVYTKDSSVSTSSDCAYVDNIKFVRS